MSDWISNFKSFIYTHYGLDEKSAQKYLASCDSTIRAMYEEKIPGPKMEQVMTYLRTKTEELPDIGHLHLVLQSDFHLYQVSEDLFDIPTDVPLHTDSGGLPTLHVGFKRWVHWNPAKCTFFVSEDMAGASYLYAPCVKTYGPAGSRKVNVLLYVLNGLTTILAAGTSLGAINDHKNVITRFLQSMPEVSMAIVAGAVNNVLLYMTHKEFGYIPSFMDARDLKTVYENGDAIAAIENTMLGASALCRLYANTYYWVEVFVDRFTQESTADLREALCEFLLAVVGVRSYWSEFETMDSDDNMHMPFKLNTELAVNSFSELKDLLT